jgi:hypothetical protein
LDGDWPGDEVEEIGKNILRQKYKAAEGTGTADGASPLGEAEKVPCGLKYRAEVALSLSPLFPLFSCSIFCFFPFSIPSLPGIEEMLDSRVRGNDE